MELPTHQAPPPEAQREPGVAARIFSAVRATWKIPVAAAAFAFLFAFGLFGLWYGAVPKTTTYISQFQFTFSVPFAPSETAAFRTDPAGALTFPNGAAFTINSIVDPAILSQVFDTLNLDQYGMRRDEFYTAFAIRPFIPTEAEIADRFKQQLADRRLSFSERQLIETKMKFEFETASRNAAELSFTVRNRLLPVEVGRAVVQMVPLAWSRNAIEKRGVLRISGFSASETLMRAGEIDNLPLPIAIVMVSEAGRRTFQRLQELQRMPGVTTMRDPASGKSIRDIEREAAEVETFQANVLRAALSQYQFPDGFAQARSIVERRIRDLELAEERETKSAAAIRDAVSQFVQAAVGLSGRPTERGGPRGSDSSGAVGGPTTIPQIGEGFLDRIIHLSRVGREGEQMFIAELTRRQLETTERANAMRLQRDLWRELLGAMQTSDAARAVFDDSAKAALVKILHAALDNVNKHWAAITRLEAEFAANRLDHTGRLYRAYAIPRDVIDVNPITSTRTIVLCISIAFLVLLVVGLGQATAFYLRTGKKWI